MSKEQLSEELSDFLENWSDNSQKNKKVFEEFMNFIFTLNNINLEFKQRPGVTYSLRASHREQSRELFCMMDVIDDIPEERWLSICFFADMIEDPEEHGDIIPGGLLGYDGYCFDLDGYDEEEIKYIQNRIWEAYNSAQ